MFEPIGVLLQFGFLAVLYLFLLWVVRGATKGLSADVSDADNLHSQVHRAVPKRKEKVTDNGRLVVVKGKGLKEGSVYEVKEGILLGRSSSSQLRLDDPFASHQHARVLASASGVHIEDLDSTNGTYLNKKQVRGSARLKPGYLIRIGDTELRYEA